MSLREDAIAIWKAGVESVDSAAAVQRSIQVSGARLCIAGVELNPADRARIEVIGAGKAGAGMAAGIESALAGELPPELLSGWVNVPADCVRPLPHIHLHAARPAGINEPTPAAVDGTEEILRRVRRLEPPDVCIVLLSGGASALLCSPVPPIRFADKLAVTRGLAASGTPIRELNLVRTQLSQVKGGRLAAACNAGQLIALIISDVIGDPLDVIGSGPTVASCPQHGEALRVMANRWRADRLPARVMHFLQQSPPSAMHTTSACTVSNHIIASNGIAMSAAARKAGELGYTVTSLGSENSGSASACGQHMMHMLRHIRRHSAGQPVCLLSGGEPTVNLTDTVNPAPAVRGGRNQELVLAAIAMHRQPADWAGIALLSGGTDGEDGPTDAAGAVADQTLIEQLQKSTVEPAEFLDRHDSWTFFNIVGGHLKTGPTHTNVMDLRVGLVSA